MDDAVGRAADGEQHAQRILERLGVMMRSGVSFVLRHLHGHGAALLGDADAIGGHRGRRRAAGQHHAERLGDAGHGARRAHHRARADARDELVVDVRDFARRRFPRRGTGPSSGGSRCRRRRARPCASRSASSRSRARSPAGRPTPRPSAAPARSCRSRRSAPPRPSAARCIISSTSIDIRLRRNIDVGEAKLSCSEITGKSIGRPPASMTPRFTASTSCALLPWQGL